MYIKEIIKVKGVSFEYISRNSIPKFPQPYTTTSFAENDLFWIHYESIQIITITSLFCNYSLSTASKRKCDSICSLSHCLWRHQPLYIYYITFNIGRSTETQTTFEFMFRNMSTLADHCTQLHVPSRRLGTGK